MQEDVYFSNGQEGGTRQQYVCFTVLNIVHLFGL